MAQKIYKSGLKGLVVCGHKFTTLTFPKNGSYYVTSSEKEQEELEKSPLFGRVFKCKILENTNVKSAEKPAEKQEAKPVAHSNIYNTESLQEARHIINEERRNRGLEQKVITNAASVLKAAKEIGLEFPNIKKR